MKWWACIDWFLESSSLLFMRHAGSYNRKNGWPEFKGSIQQCDYRLAITQHF